MTAPQTQVLKCNHCGANLAVGSSIRFITCGHCNTSLEIKREGGAIFSQLTDAVESLRDDVKILRLQNELERIAREWKTRVETLVTTDKDGNTLIPTRILGP